MANGRGSLGEDSGTYRSVDRHGIHRCKIPFLLKSDMYIGEPRIFSSYTSIMNDSAETSRLVPDECNRDTRQQTSKSHHNDTS
jgi:hypothetical protein